MPKTIEAVYEGGVFKPVRKVTLPDRSRVRLTLTPLPSLTPAERKRLVERQRKALLRLVGIADSGRTDISKRHDEHLYGKSG